MTATLALGTHRISGEELAAAARRAASSPGGWIDTAPNYAHGRAHRLLAPVLAENPHVAIATKTGFLTGATARCAHAAGVIAHPEIRHSLSPSYVRWQIDRSRAEFGRDPELVFVNSGDAGPSSSPETQPGPGGGARVLAGVRGVVRGGAADLPAPPRAGSSEGCLCRRTT